MNSNLPSIRFSAFKSDWKFRQIGDLLVDVSRPIKMKDDQIYQLVTVKRRNAGIVSRGYFKGADVLVKSQFIVQMGDYLISKRQIVHGANGIVPEHLSDSIVSNEYLVLHGTNDLNVEYLSIISKLPSMYKMFYLSSYGVDIEKLVFNVSDWKKRELAIPSIEEQAKITLFFNKLDKLISLHQQELDALKKAKQSFLKKMFPENGENVPRIRFSKFTNNWEFKKVKNVISLLKDGTHGTHKDGEYAYLLSAKNIKFGKVLLNPDQDRKIAKIDYKQIYKNYELENEDLLVTIVGTIGQTALYYKDDNAIAFQRSVGIIRGNEDVSQLFLKAIFDSSLIQKQLKKSSSISAQPGVYLGDLEKMTLMLPTIDEQIKIGEFFKEMDEVIDLKEQELEAMIQTKKGFLQKMFV